MRKLLRAPWRHTLLGLLLLAPLPALAGKTQVYTNQSYLEDALNAPDFKIDDQQAVLSLVLNSLPDTVKVYPTENYYYFYFYYKGIKYAGNLRFDVDDREKGIVHFSYFKDFTDWQHDENSFGDALGAKQGVTVKPAGKLAYDVEFKGRRVHFQLNDLSGVKPPPSAVQKDETYIGPVFDESGIRFFLIFNEKVKTFHFILDETVPEPDQFNKASAADRITIGIRTGFAFYADRFADRKILVGVQQGNTWINNYLDGPFDQLPDNFLVGETLRKAIIAATPEEKGQIDRYGNYADKERRYLIAPYLQYNDEKELGIISECAASEVRPIYYKCFSFADSPDDGADSNQDSQPQQ